MNLKWSACFFGMICFGIGAHELQHNGSTWALMGSGGCIYLAYQCLRGAMKYE